MIVLIGIDLTYNFKENETKTIKESKSLFNRSILDLFKKLFILVKK